MIQIKIHHFLSYEYLPPGTSDKKCDKVYAISELLLDSINISRIKEDGWQQPPSENFCNSW